MWCLTLMKPSCHHECRHPSPTVTVRMVEVGVRLRCWTPGSFVTFFSFWTNPGKHFASRALLMLTDRSSFFLITITGHLVILLGAENSITVYEMSNWMDSISLLKKLWNFIYILLSEERRNERNICWKHFCFIWNFKFKKGRHLARTR